MRVPPPEVMATWPARNPIDPERRGPALVIIQLTILPLAWLSLALRLYVRMYLLRSGGWDDWIMVAAAVFATSVTVCVILASSLFGWDIHVWDLSIPDMISGRQVSMAAQSLYIVATTLAKTSILLSYVRFAPLGSWFRRATLWTIYSVVVANIAFFIVLWTQCTPISDYWNLHGKGHCISESPPLLAQAILAVIADFVVWVLPLHTLLHTRLPTNQRIALVTLFSFGLFVVFAGCMRTYWGYHVTAQTYDVTWEGFNVWIWTAVEVNLGIICGCVPCVNSLFKRKGSTGGGSKPVYIGDASQSMRDAELSVRRGSRMGAEKKIAGSTSEEYINLEQTTWSPTNDPDLERDAWIGR